jgi:hypothetical protein
MDDTEMVHRLIRISPVYQTWLSDDAVQQLSMDKGTPDIVSTTKEILGHINEAATWGAGRNAGEMWQTAKSKFNALRSHIAGGKGSDPISAVTDWIGEQIDQYGAGIAKYDPKSQPAQRTLAAIPVVGSTAASILDDLNNDRYADAALKTGKGIISARVASKLPEIKTEVSSLLGRTASAIKPPPEVAAGTAYENAVAPGGLSAADQAAMRSDWQRARKYIGKQTETAPVPKGEGAAMRSAAVTRKAANELWETHVEPVIDKFSGESASTSDVAQRIRATPSEIDIASRPGIVKKIDRLASVFDRDMTIKEMNAKVTELNADKSVTKFYEMSGVERAEALKADPTLDGKVAALNGLREKMFDTISEKWTDEGGAMFREARKDYGALRNVEENFREAKVPTPKSLGTRIANTARTTISLHNATEYLRSPVSTVLDLNNPNRLAAKAVNKAGKVGEAIPAPPRLPLYSRPAGPAAAQALPPMTAEGVRIPAPPSAPVGGLPPAGFPAPQPLPNPYASANPAAMWGERAVPISTSEGLYGEAAAAEARRREMGGQGRIAPRRSFGPGGESQNVIGPGTYMGRPEPSVKGAPIPKPPRGAANYPPSAPASGIVGATFKQLGITDLVTPRQQKTLETLVRGPRWKDMDALDRTAAVRSVLNGKGQPQ